MSCSTNNHTNKQSFDRSRWLHGLWLPEASRHFSNPNTSQSANDKASVTASESNDSSANLSAANSGDQVPMLGGLERSAMFNDS